MKIEETISEKAFSIEASDPYDECLEIMNKMSELGDVVVTKNTFSTNGPRKLSLVEFKVRKGIDEFSSLCMECRMNGMKMSEDKKGTVYISLKSSFITEIEENKFFGSVFKRYYASGPIKMSREKARELNRMAESFVESHKVFA